jgi:gamma-glutamylputrescine oxidase
MVGNYTVAADKIVVAADHFMPELHIIEPAVYHVQTFLAISEPLSDADLVKIFPKDRLMVWDTELIYEYFRPTGENRLLFGAANINYTYKKTLQTDTRSMVKKMNRFLKDKFPQVNVPLDYIWPGLIGISEDFVPLAGQDKTRPSVYYVGAGAGLPWSAALGVYIADKIHSGRQEFDDVFSAERKVPIRPPLSSILGKPLSFAISHGITKYLS